MSESAPARSRSALDRALLLIVVLLLAWAAAVSLLFAERVLAFRGVPKGATPADSGLAYDEVPLASRDGTHLSAWWIRPADGVRRPDLAVVVLAHDVEGSRADLLPFATRLARAGFLVLDLDLRAHGASAGRRTTAGFDEADDVAAAVAFARARALGAPIALFGEGMGGAASVSVCLRDPALAYTFVHDAGGSYETRLYRRPGRPRGPRWALVIPWLVRVRIEALVGRGFRMRTSPLGQAWDRLGALRFATVDDSMRLSGRPARERAAGTDVVKFLEGELAAAP
jgi:predicted alpha/beta hydrolase